VFVLITFDALAVNVILVKSQIWVASHTVKVPSVIFSGQRSAATYTGLFRVPEPYKFIKNLLQFSAVLADAFNVLSHLPNFSFRFFALSHSAPFN
jgi:hypothetical protein